MKVTLLFGAALVLALTACTKKNEPSELNPHLKYARNIISTRPTNSKQLIAVVKLKSPALLEVGSKQNGRLLVNDELIEQINKEQEEAMAALKALSPQVEVIFRYKMVLNGIAIVAPIELESKIKGLGVVAYSETSGNFERAKTFELSNSVSKPTFNERNSAKFIGAETLNARGITGKGIKVGVIDTGIDFTHAMMGGVGTEDAFKAVDPAANTEFFPNKKVVGGIDLVGTTYNAASPDFVNHLPKPDMNPLDEGGHGTHVAGTVAGLGDGVHSYNGIAPEADLHAIKVFGADGSTSDFVVIAALEYSADPNADGQNDDQLNVVNLSLGSSYGNPHILYGEAVKNLVNGGTVVVASAGNSGHKDYIVGAPGTSDAAISVAASIDNGDHLWKFSASRINLGAEQLLVEAIEAATTKKIADAPVVGELVAAGLGLTDFDEALAAKVNGKVALMDRGQVNFNDKIKRAVKAGAIGVVMVNNSPAAPISMGTTDKFEIPAIMITLADGLKIKAALAVGAANIEFKTDEKIEKPQLIDTLTDFTSKGPRSIDGLIKPEISAPGENVISAAMGGGAETVQMSGTSMAAPHMAGVMALLKQAKPTLTAEELKSVVMASTKSIAATDGKRYPVSMQGAGRVQADVAADLKLVSDVHAISLGEVGVETKKTVRRQIKLKNLTTVEQSLSLEFEGNGFISMSAAQIKIDAGKTTDVVLSLTLDATSMKDEKIREMDGWVLAKQEGQEVYRIPVLAIAHKLSGVDAKSLVVNATSDRDASGASAELELENLNSNGGEALLFNLIGGDDRKPYAPSFMTSDCDLQSAGYRLVKAADGSDNLQVAVKLFKPVTTWHACDISLMIDIDGDGVAEQELLGSNVRSIPGLTGDQFVTTLLDAVKTREIRKTFEAAVLAAGNDKDKLAELSEDYKGAIVDQKAMKVYNNSTVAVLQIPASKLAMTRDGAISFKIVVTHNEQGSVEFDDHLLATVKADKRISLRAEDQSYVGLSDINSLLGLSSQKVNLVKGDGREDLLVLMPFNRFSQSNLHEDSQSQVLKAKFETK
jgi:minor extracellular serine protease Vpr